MSGKGKIKVLTTKANRFGSGVKVTLADNTMVKMEFDEKGVAEVDAKYVEALVDADPSISVMADKAAIKKAIEAVEGKEIAEIVAINESLKALNASQKEELDAANIKITQLEVENEKLKKAMSTEVEEPIQSAETTTGPGPIDGEESEAVKNAKAKALQGLKDELNKNKVPALKQILKDNANTAGLEDEWKDLEKEELVAFIIAH